MCFQVNGVMLYRDADGDRLGFENVFTKTDLRREHCASVGAGGLCRPVHPVTGFHTRPMAVSPGCSRRVKRSSPGLPQHDYLAVDQGFVRRFASNRLRDRREARGEVDAATAPDLLALALLMGEDAEPLMLDFVRPAESGGRSINE
jgi:hypothetical protein